MGLFVRPFLSNVKGQMAYKPLLSTYKEAAFITLGLRARPELAVLVGGRLCDGEQDRILITFAHFRPIASGRRGIYSH